MEKSEKSLVIHSGSVLSWVEPATGKIVDEMVDCALSLHRAVKATNLESAKNQHSKKLTPGEGTYYAVHALFELLNSGDRYVGRWHNFTLEQDISATTDNKNHALNITDAESIVNRCIGKPARVSQVVSQDSEPPPFLFDLNELQKCANRAHGLTAENTLNIVMTLYNDLRIITNPLSISTDADKYYYTSVKKMVGSLNGMMNIWDRQYQENLKRLYELAVANNYLRNDNSAFQRISKNDLIAIIPTGSVPTRKLTEEEQIIYHLISCRSIVSIYPNAESEITQIITRVCNNEKDVFVSEQRSIISRGWLAVNSHHTEVHNERSLLRDYGLSSYAKNFPSIINGEVASAIDCLHAVAKK